MFATGHFFDEFYLCKPYSSREANSETYLVGKGFRGADIDHPYIQAMFDRIENKVQLEVPLFDAKHYPKEYLKDLSEINEKIFLRQISKISADIDRVHKARRIKGDIRTNPVINEFQNRTEPELEKWYTDYPVFPIKSDDALNMKDSMHQR